MLGLWVIAACRGGPQYEQTLAAMGDGYLVALASVSRN